MILQSSNKTWLGNRGLLCHVEKEVEGDSHVRFVGLGCFPLCLDSFAMIMECFQWRL